MAGREQRGAAPAHSCLVPLRPGDRIRPGRQDHRAGRIGGGTEHRFGNILLGGDRATRCLLQRGHGLLGEILIGRGNQAPAAIFCWTEAAKLVPGAMPGITTLARMPNWPSSSATDSVSDVSADLLAR